MKTKFKRYLWEFVKILRFDNMVTISPTFRCNQKCWYCCQGYVEHGKHPEKDYKFWIDLIKRKNIKVLAISGGECSLYEGVEHIVNYCVDNNILVNIVTNLSNIIPNIKKSWRVTFFASYHEGADLKIFMKNYTELSKDFWITVNELHKDNIKILPFSVIREVKTNWVIGESKCPYVNYYPDGTLMPKYKFDEKNNTIMGYILFLLRKLSNYKKRFNVDNEQLWQRQ